MFMCVHTVEKWYYVQFIAISFHILCFILACAKYMSSGITFLAFYRCLTVKCTLTSTRILSLEQTQFFLNLITKLLTKFQYYQFITNLEKGSSINLLNKCSQSTQGLN